MGNDSGFYQIEAGELSHHSLIYGSWKIPISAISLIGEYTNEDGPGLDDYFFVFLTAEDSSWYEASFYGANREEILQELGATLASPLSSELAHSTSFLSRVIWPEKMKGEPLFTFHPHSRHKVRRKLTPEIQSKRRAEQGF